MTAKKHITRHTFGSDLKRVDAHAIQAHEYDAVPELIDEDLSRGVFRRAGRPIASDPRKQVTIRLSASVLKRWRDSGAGWQTRMAEILERRAP